MKRWRQEGKAPKLASGSPLGGTGRGDTKALNGQRGKIEGRPLRRSSPRGGGILGRREGAASHTSAADYRFSYSYPHIRTAANNTPAREDKERGKATPAGGLGTSRRAGAAGRPGHRGRPLFNKRLGSTPAATNEGVQLTATPSPSPKEPSRSPNHQGATLNPRAPPPPFAAARETPLGGRPGKSAKAQQLRNGRTMPLCGVVCRCAAICGRSRIPCAPARQGCLAHRLRLSGRFSAAVCPKQPAARGKAASRRPSHCRRPRPSGEQRRRTAASGRWGGKALVYLIIGHYSVRA